MMTSAGGVGWPSEVELMGSEFGGVAADNDDQWNSTDVGECVVGLHMGLFPTLIPSFNHPCTNFIHGAVVLGIGPWEGPDWTMLVLVLQRIDSHCYIPTIISPLSCPHIYLYPHGYNPTAMFQRLYSHSCVPTTYSHSHVPMAILRQLCSH